MQIISERFSRILIVVGLVLTAIAILAFTLKSNFLKIPIPGDRFGQLGDTIGGLVGSMWALAGVILFYINLKEQRQAFATSNLSLEKQTESLEMQRAELELQRKEYERSYEGFQQQQKLYEEQSKGIRLQQFEATFYQLLDVYIKIRNGLDAIDKNKDFFASLYKKMTLDYRARGSAGENFIAAKELYEDEYFDNKGRLTHYLKTIYRIVKIIDDSDLTDQQKYFYSKIIRSQFTEYELFILYYNSQVHYGTKFYPLILRYNLLKHLPLLSKLEFNGIRLGITLPDSKIMFFQSWLDLFLEENLNVASQSIEETGVNSFSRSKSCHIIEGLVVEITVGLSTDITFHFTALKPNDNNEFINFVENYLFDRLYFSRYPLVSE